MKKILLGFALSSATMFSASALCSETKISGFGSLVGTSLLSEEGYWVKNPSGAGYYAGDVGLDLKEESLIGIQGVIKPNDDITIVGQVIARGQDDYTPTLEQFYVGYDINSSWNTKVGKLRNPIYLYSDVIDIHYAFPWIRTPGASYSLSANSFDGVSLMFTGDIGNVSNRTIFYYGRSLKNPDPFLTELFINRGFTTQFTTGEQDADGNFYKLTEHKNDIQDAYGFSTEFYIGSMTFHAAFMDAGGEKDVKTYENGSTFDEVYDKRDFYDLAVSYDDGNWLAIAEWNNYVEVYSSYYVTLGKTFGSWQALITTSNFEGEVVLPSGFELPKSQQEQTDTLAFTLRYDVSSSVALKAELIQFSNKGSLIVPDEDGDGEIDSTVLSFAIDFVF